MTKQSIFAFVIVLSALLGATLVWHYASQSHPDPTDGMYERSDATMQEAYEEDAAADLLIVAFLFLSPIAVGAGLSSYCLWPKETVTMARKLVNLMNEPQHIRTSSNER